MPSRVVLSAALAAFFTLNAPCFAQDLSAIRKTHTYKTVDRLEIHADVFARPAGAKRPVVLWIHGGALIVGHREQIDRKLFGRLLDAGYSIVSIDYRLAPEVKLPAIQEDIKDAYEWVRLRGPDLFGADPDRIAVMGGSAGGYLTLSTGHRVRPRPKALVTFWGYGDIAAEWYARPDAFYRQQKLVSRDEARQVVGGPVITGTPGKNDRGKFYLYCRQNGLWTLEVAGIDPLRNPRALDPYCPLRNVNDTYPPTLLVHGTADTDVPYEQSKQMAEELNRKGRIHEFITIPNGPHGLRGVDQKIVDNMYDRIMAFLKRHIEADAPTTKSS